MSAVKGLRGSIVIAGSDGDIGRALVRLFSAAGIKPVGLSRKALHKKGLSAALRLDLSDPKAVEAAAKKLCAKGKTVRCVINAAGYWRKTGDASWEKDVLRHNLGVADNLLKAFTPRLAGVEGARIITIGSVDHKYPNVNSYSYTVAKAAVKALVGAYRKRHREGRVNFDLVAPGAVAGRMRAHKAEDKSALLQPEDVARVCRLLCSLGSNAAFEDIVIYPKTFAYSVP